eukprot:1753575-Rhodomonas_salina.2
MFYRTATNIGAGARIKVLICVAVYRQLRSQHVTPTSLVHQALVVDSGGAASLVSVGSSAHLSQVPRHGRLVRTNPKALQPVAIHSIWTHATLQAELRRRARVEGAAETAPGLIAPVGAGEAFQWQRWLHCAQVAFEPARMLSRALIAVVNQSPP